MTTVTLGLDGGCFELIEPWLERGELPAIERLRDEGITGDLQSCLPPVTCPNWKCYATGTNPGKLGVFWWELIDRDAHEIRNTSSNDDFDGREFWTLVDGEVAIVNLPTSYPPPSVDGVHVAGGPGSEQTGYTNPSSLEADLRAEYEYQVHPEKMSLLSKSEPDSPCVDEIYGLIDQRFDLLTDLVQSGEYEFVHTTVFYLNVLQHFYWDHDVVKRAWKRIDHRIGDLLECDELDRLFVMSDHGSNEIDIEFHINTWLEQEGYLHTTDSGTNWLAKAGITRERIRPVLGKLGVEWWARQLVPERIQNRLPDEDGRVKKAGKARVIDWERSTAVASGQGPVYVLADTERERERISDDLQTSLDGLTIDEKPVVETALLASDVYEGPHLDRGPDIVLKQAPHVHIDGRIGGDDVTSEPDTWRGENKDTGLFVAHGDDIGAGVVPDDMHILDIAPTVLHVLGYPVPERYDGTVRMGLFASDAEAADREPDRITLGSDDSRRDATSGDSDVTDRLEDLGYL